MSRLLSVACGNWLRTNIIESGVIIVYIYFIEMTHNKAWNKLHIASYSILEELFYSLTVVSLSHIRVTDSVHNSCLSTNTGVRVRMCVCVCV